MNLTVLGMNFRTAPIGLREKVSFTSSGIPPALQRILEQLPESELVLVSTCNRTELYVAGIEIADRKGELVRALLTDLQADETGELSQHFYLKTSHEAAEHLIAVVCSLDSMVVGETEILGQVKEAYMLARQEGTVGKILNPLFQTAFRYAKRVHTETDICRGRVSVSSIAVDFACKVFDQLDRKTVMIVGAGETAELALKSLVDKGVNEVLVLNRSFHKGKALAEQHGGRAIQFELLTDYLPGTDIVISSTAAPHCVIHANTVRSAIKARRGRPMLLIDIAVPRDIEAAAGDLENVYLYHIDDLQKVAYENLSKREQGVETAWRIVKEGTAELAATFEGGALRLLLREFDGWGREIRDSAIKRAFAKEKLSSLPEPCRDEIETLVHKTVNKMLAAPREALKKAAKNGQWDEYARVARDLFDLKNDSEQESLEKESERETPQSTGNEK
jgi:glutamyl-tRNA reductase